MKQASNKLKKLKHTDIIGYILIGIAITLWMYTVFWTNDRNQQITENSPLNLIDNSSVSFMIAGDAMLGRAVAYQFKNDVTQAFENLPENYFGNVDVGVLNLEGPISDTDPGYNTNPENLIFSFPLQTIDALKYLGVKAVSLGNNHSQNQGKTGLQTTRELLSQANITPIGSQTSFDEESVKEFGKLSIITIDTLDDRENITDAIKQEKEKDQFVLVFPHWGSEYLNDRHSNSQENLAHDWIDAGADIIIGSHPHVIEDAEIYQNKPIFYSLGNFIFDQTFSTETMRGLILKGEISHSKTTIEIIPIKNYHLRVELLSGEEKDTIINQFKEQLGTDKFNENILEI